MKKEGFSCHYFLLARICIVALLCSSAAWGSEQILYNNLGNNTEKWRIVEPDVTKLSNPYNIHFRDGDIVTVNAGGCVQTGGTGLTWKRYVDPRSSPIPNDLVNPWTLLPESTQFHGLVSIPGATNGFVRIKDVLGKTLTARISNINYLQLGYEDDTPENNGYWNRDVGIGNQCAFETNAWVEINIQHSTQQSTAAGGQASYAGAQGGGGSGSSQTATTTTAGQTGSSTTAGAQGGGNITGKGPDPSKQSDTFKDTSPPKLLSFIVTPNTLTYQGGPINVDVQASDNVGVKTVTTFLIRPDNQQITSTATLISGTQQMGGWRTTWNIPMNTGNMPLSYGIKVTVADAANNVVANQLTITVPVKPGPPKPPPPKR